MDGCYLDSGDIKLRGTWNNQPISQTKCFGQERENEARDFVVLLVQVEMAGVSDERGIVRLTARPLGTTTGRREAISNCCRQSRRFIWRHDTQACTVHDAVISISCECIGKHRFRSIALIDVQRLHDTAERLKTRYGRHPTY
jgi:hypothetical protein